MYSGYRITFDSGGSWSFDNDIARNVIMFGVDNSSSFRAANCKIIFVVLELMKNLIHQRKNLVLILVKQPKFCLSFHYNADNSCLFVNGKEIFKFKADNKTVNFPTNRLNATESREVSLNENVFDFSVDYNSIDKSNILNIHQYLMNKNNIK